MARVTQAQADAALYDWRVPPAEALRLFLLAYRRSNDITQGFTLHMAGVVRQQAEDRHMIEAWENEGGPCR